MPEPRSARAANWPALALSLLACVLALWSLLVEPSNRARPRSAAVDVAPTPADLVKRIEGIEDRLAALERASALDAPIRSDAGDGSSRRAVGDERVAAGVAWSDFLEAHRENLEKLVDRSVSEHRAEAEKETHLARIRDRVRYYKASRSLSPVEASELERVLLLAREDIAQVESDYLFHGEKPLEETADYDRWISGWRELIEKWSPEVAQAIGLPQLAGTDTIAEMILSIASSLRAKPMLSDLR